MSTSIVIWIAVIGVPAPAEYVFVADTERRVGFLRDGVVHIGTLDGVATFHEQEVDDLRKSRSVRMRRVGSEWLPSHLSGPYLPIKCRGPAFELRSGKLIIGAVDRNGEFAATAGAATIRFEDYRQATGA